MSVQCDIVGVSDPLKKSLFDVIQNARYYSGSNDAKGYFKGHIKSPVDILVMTDRYFIVNKGNCLSSALRRAFKEALEGFTDAELLSCTDTLPIKLRDVIRLVHPVPNAGNRIALSKLTKPIKQHEIIHT